MADAIAEALLNLREARQQAAMSVAEEQTKLKNLDQMIKQLESKVIIIDPELMPHRTAYKGLGTTEAARRFLEEVGKPQTAPEIAQGLLERGLERKEGAGRFISSLGAILKNNLETNKPLFTRHGEGRATTWSLRKERGGR